MENTLKNNLHLLMDGLTEQRFANEVGLPKSTINRLLSGRTPDPRASTLQPIAKYFNISIDQLLGFTPLPTDLPIYREKELVSVAYVDYVEETNLLKYLTKNYVASDKIEVVKNHKKRNISKTCFFTKIECFSMFPKFTEDSYLLVNPDLLPKNKDFAIVFIEANNSIILRQIIIEGNNIYLKANQPMFDSIKLLDDDRILGIVLEARIFTDLIVDK